MRRGLGWGIIPLACLATVAATWQRPSPSGPWPNAAVAQNRLRVSSPFTLLWSHSIADLSDIALSPDGKWVSTVSRNRKTVALWQPGQNAPLWSRRVPGITHVAVSANRQYVLAYPLLDPTQHTVVLLKGTDGTTLWKTPLNGAIWDMTLAPDGQSAAFVTGQNTVYSGMLTDRPTFAQWPLAGIGNSVALSSNRGIVATGTWDAGGVACYSSQGVVLWRYPQTGSDLSAQASRRFDVESSQDGRFVLGLSFTNARQANGRLYLWRGDGNGQPLWTYELGANVFSPQADISADGRFVSVSFRRVISYGSQSIEERRLIVLDQNGHMVWNGERGGMLFSPTLVAFAADGNRLTVSDGQRTLFCLDAAGRIIARYRLSGQILQTTATPDGRFALAYTSDGRISLLQLA